MMKYQNIGFANQRSTFAEISSGAVTSVAIFANQVKKAPVAGGSRVSLLNGSITVNQEFTPASCDPCGSTRLNASVKLQWNVQDGTALIALRDEVIRLMDVAVANHNLTSGLVPPVTATFEV